jgi:hypothetical protein
MGIVFKAFDDELGIPMTHSFQGRLLFATGRVGNKNREQTLCNRDAVLPKARAHGITEGLRLTGFASSRLSLEIKNRHEFGPLLWHATCP